MCSKDKLHILWILVGVVCVTISIGLLRHVFNVSTLDILFVTPVVLVIGFAYTIKMMSDVEHIHLALLAIFFIPISCTFEFVLRIRSLLTDWSSLKILWKIIGILHLTFLIGKK
ncbi:uncharacterized protein [Drosophila takahashii]|uniref:uncharacterized protein n=1 Tax=Drosophila takahashii TaxID=29030 RepID=UPI001CF8FA8D|nr:uncharacterized protein LOC108056484 [Drosophila takahashii]